MRLARITKTFYATLFALVLFFMAGSAYAALTYQFDIQGINYPADYTGVVTLGYEDSDSSKYLDVTLKNTSPHSDAAITGFAFKGQLPFNPETEFESSQPGWKAEYNPVGFHSPGAGLFETVVYLEGPGKQWFARNPNNGIFPGATAEFKFKYDPAAKFDFANLGDINSYNFVARFQGGPDSDLAAAVPLPGAVWLLGSGLLGLIAIRRRSSK